MTPHSNALEGFPPLLQTVFYGATLLVSLAVASHGYFRGWLKKMIPAKDLAAAEGGHPIEHAIVLDRSEMRALSDAINRMDTTVRSCQEDMRRSQDRTDRLIDLAEDLIAILRTKT